MAAATPRSAVAAWAVLVLATIVAWVVGSDAAREWAGAVVLALSAVKASLVAWEFMGLRRAPRGLRALVLGELAVGAAGLLILFLA